MLKTYLGDGIYAEFDGYQICIFTSNGIRQENKIYFEGENIESFLEFVKQVKELAS
jgi:hypothetical protein